MSKVKELKKQLNTLAKEHPELNIKYAKKAKVAELAAILEAANAALAAQSTKKDADQEKENEVTITPEMVARFNDEENPEYCGTFGKVNFDSPACKECAEIMKKRNVLCTATSVQAAQKKEASSKKRASGGNGSKRSEYKDFIAQHIAEGTHTRASIIDAFVAAFPEAAKSTVTTYISDGPNPKYCAFTHLLNIDKQTKVVSYSKTPAPGRSGYAKANGQYRLTLDRGA